MTEPEQKEASSYVGNRVPPILRFAWTVFIIFAIIYFVLYLVPDLKDWFHKSYAG